ncbi:MAG: hypothetical protein WA777_18515 [Rhodanobacter sp.]
MKIKGDGLDYPGFALKNRHTGEISLSDVCSAERVALEVRRQMNFRVPHRGQFDVVPVVVSITELKD